MPAGDTNYAVGEMQGVLSLSEYVNAFYPGYPAEEQTLMTICFQTAVHRQWYSPDGSITSVWLIQFGTGADARDFIAGPEQAVDQDPANTDVFQVSQVTDGMGYGDPKPDTYGNTTTLVAGDAGNVAILIYVWLPARTDNSFASSLLLRQSDLLTSASS